MCGIVGAWHATPQPEQGQEGLARAMLDAIRHRGPDDGGFVLDSRCVLGNRRLSIQDLSSAGNQPFFDDQGALWLVFNGEIYNYVELRNELEDRVVFHGNSDTEVLLRAYERWGTSCVDRLVGMFAFAVWEPDTERLTLCRDRLGKKPLYYHWDGARLLFASEAKALLAAGVPARADVDTCADYLLDGIYDHGQHTFFEGIKQVGRGCFLTVDDRGIRERRYWDLAEKVAVAPPAAPADAVFDLYLHQLEEAVRLRMRTDVPCAVMLSGGLDSSVLAVLAERHLAGGVLDVMTFRTDDPRYDEGPWAKMAAVGRSWCLNSVTLDSAEVMELVPRLLWHQDEPFGGVATVGDVLLARYAREQGIYVVLEGQGADETLAGYEYYFAHHLADLDERDPAAARDAYRAYARLRGRDPEGSFADLTAPVVGAMRGHSQDGTRSVLPEALHPDLVLRGRGLERQPRFYSRLTGALYRDLTLSKVPRVLRFKDKAYMMYGVELRAPFLDHRLVELAFSLPAEAKLASGYTKHCLREAFRHHLPPEIAFHVKRPVQTPQREWLRTSMAAMVKDVIHSDSFARRGLFDVARARQVYDDYQARPERYDNSFFLWQWVMLEWWHRLFVDGTRPAESSYAVRTENIRRFPPARTTVAV